MRGRKFKPEVLEALALGFVLGFACAALLVGLAQLYMHGGLHP